MVGCKKIGHFRKLSKYMELLIHALEVNSPQTITHPPTAHGAQKSYAITPRPPCKRAKMSCDCICDLV